MNAKLKRRGRGPSLARVAHHEAGHAVVGEVLGAKVIYATFVPTKRCRAYVHHAPTDSMRAVLMLYAGPLAAARRAGKCIPWAVGRMTGRRSEAVRCYGGSNDLAEAASIAGLGSPGTDARERRAYLRWAWEQARVLVERHWPEIEGVAAALVQRRRMKGSTVREAMQRARVARKLSAANAHPR